MGNYILPLVLILLISSAVFWMDREAIHLADRLSVSFTSVLTVVAFDFVTSEKLPSLGYSTVMDMILTASYLFLALSILENVISMRLTGSRPAVSRALDKAFRFLFPVAYVICVLWLMIFGGPTEA